LHNPNIASGRGAIAKFHIKRDTTGHRRCYEGWQPRRGRRGAPSSLPQEEHNQPPRADSNSSIVQTGIWVDFLTGPHLSTRSAPIARSTEELEPARGVWGFPFGDV